MIGITTNAEQVAARIQAKANALTSAVQTAVRSGLIAVETEVVRNLSGSNSAASYSYPVPARTGNLKNNRSIAQPEPGIGILTLNSDYAWAVETGVVREWAGRGKSRTVQRTPRPFAENAINTAKPGDYLIDGVIKAMAA